MCFKTNLFSSGWLLSERGERNVRQHRGPLLFQLWKHGEFCPSNVTSLPSKRASCHLPFASCQLPVASCYRRVVLDTIYSVLHPTSVFPFLQNLPEKLPRNMGTMSQCFWVRVVLDVNKIVETGEEDPVTASLDWARLLIEALFSKPGLQIRHWKALSVEQTYSLQFILFGV